MERGLVIFGLGKVRRGGVSGLIGDGERCGGRRKRRMRCNPYLLRLKSLCITHSGECEALYPNTYKKGSLGFRSSVFG